MIESGPAETPQPPSQVADFAKEIVEYVKRSTGLDLSFDSETLPILDHYLRSIPKGEAAMINLIASTAGAYFGEVVRRHIGGRWEATNPESYEWLMILPSGLTFKPAQLAHIAITHDDEDMDVQMSVPEPIENLVGDVLKHMADVSEDTYYSLCGWLDTIEHVQSVVTTVIAKRLEEMSHNNN